MSWFKRFLGIIGKRHFRTIVSVHPPPPPPDETPYCNGAKHDTPRWSFLLLPTQQSFKEDLSPREKLIANAPLYPDEFMGFVALPHPQGFSKQGSCSFHLVFFCSCILVRKTIDSVLY